MKIKELQKLIDEVIENSKRDYTLQDLVRNIKVNESIIDYKTIRNYIKSEREAKSVYKLFYAKLPKIFIYECPVCHNIVKMDIKPNETFCNCSSKPIKPRIYILNYKVKNAEKLKELILFITNVWYEYGSKYEIYELLGLNEKQYKRLLNQ